MQGACDLCGLQRLSLAVFLAQSHETGHFDLGDIHFFAAPIGEAGIGDLAIIKGHGGLLI